MDLFSEYFPKLLKNKLFLVYTVLIAVLVIILVAFSSNLFLSYQKAEENREKINTIETFLAKFSEQKKYLESIEERPIKQSELDDVQTELFKHIKRYKLNLVKFNAKSSSEKGSNFKDFNMTVSGDYINVMEFLGDFHARNALMTIKYLNLQQQNGIISANLVYTVYFQ